MKINLSDISLSHLFPFEGPTIAPYFVLHQGIVCYLILKSGFMSIVFHQNIMASPGSLRLAIGLKGKY